jgi:ABC-2 type transport system ATP-binding protein
VNGVETVGVTKRFRRKVAVDDLSLSIGPGITGLLGPNGAGKTTLLRMVATVLAPDAGRLRILDLDPAKADERVAIRRRLGYVPQEPGFHPSFTAFEYVDYIAILKEMVDRQARHDEVRRVLALVGLDDVRRQTVRSLSGGMRRRLAIAQALLGSPALLVLDEPTAGLDPEQRLRFRELVSTLATDTCVLLSTHQTEDVGALCQRVVVLHEGSVRFDGTPVRLARQAAGRVWRSVTRDPAARLAWITGEGFVRNIGDAPPDVELLEPTIEDAYLLLAGEAARAPVAR